VIVVAPDVCIADLKPRMEGANIRTWIGFKHLMYLAEDAVLTWFRRNRSGPSRLYHRSGLALDITNASLLLANLVDVDDELIAESSPIDNRQFSVRLRPSGSIDRTLLSGKLTVRVVPDPAIHPVEPPPRAVEPYVVTEALRGPRLSAREWNDRRSRAFHWPWVARYFHCEYSRVVQHSAYVRALEEVVDRFLADRGLAIGRMLVERSLIPVVSRVRVELLEDALMEETIHTTFVVTEVLKEKAFDGRMDCYVERDDAIVHVATARILHGYAISMGPAAGQLARLDGEMVRALRPTS